MSRKARKEMMQILREAGCDEAVREVETYALLRKLGKMREQLGRVENERDALASGRRTK